MLGMARAQAASCLTPSTQARPLPSCTGAPGARKERNEPPVIGPVRRVGRAALALAGGHFVDKEGGTVELARGLPRVAALGNLDAQ